jgi:hypothetical protein
VLGAINSDGSVTVMGDVQSNSDDSDSDNGDSDGDGSDDSDNRCMMCIVWMHSTVTIVAVTIAAVTIATVTIATVTTVMKGCVMYIV